MTKSKALPRDCYWRRNRARARCAGRAVNRSEHRDERERGITVAARCSLRGTTHTRTRTEPDTPERGAKEHCHAEHTKLNGGPGDWTEGDRSRRRIKRN
ncbi:hypothetical protein EVAR_28384_1 [Eumeta japonica]|uniref:Uncharacterized protein n=1 Tax=Eumeta variegata TaxID=151549 RepID=A0A4C1XG37_EUMVA|nr:hypothetical protein EVAR_28384_1 [Eumeta japonica]